MKNNIKNMTDDELYIKWLKSEYGESLYNSFKDFLNEMQERGYTVEEDMSLEDFWRVNNELPMTYVGPYTKESYDTFIQEMRDVYLTAVLEVKIYNPDKEIISEYYLWDGYEINTMGEYIYTVKVGEKEFKFKISIDQYEIIVDGLSAFAYDMKDDKYLKIKSGTYGEENTNISVDELESISTDDWNCWNYWTHVEKNKFIKVNFVCEPNISIYGYFIYFSVPK